MHIDALLRRQDASLPVTIRNLGFGGAGIEIVEPTHAAPSPDKSRPFDLLIGDQVMVEIIAPVLWDPLHLNGTVVWSKPVAGAKPSRAGVRFDPLGRAPLLSLFDVLCAV